MGRGTDEQISLWASPGQRSRALPSGPGKKFSASTDGVEQNVSPGGKTAHIRAHALSMHDARHPHAHVCAQISGYGVGEAGNVTWSTPLNGK